MSAVEFAASAVPIRPLGQMAIQVREYARKHFRAWLVYTAIGGLLMVAQLKLQAIELSDGQSHTNLLWLAPLQGSVLGEIGLLLNWVLMFRCRLPLVGVLACGNLQKLPHSVAEWGAYAILLQLFGYQTATVVAAGVVGIMGFVLMMWWAKHLAQLSRLAASLMVWAVVAVQFYQRIACAKPRVRGPVCFPSG